jgi:hypothetical protein
MKVKNKLNEIQAIKMQVSHLLPSINRYPPIPFSSILLKLLQRFGFRRRRSFRRKKRCVAVTLATFQLHSLLITRRIRAVPVSTSTLNPHIELIYNFGLYP